MLGSIIGDMVGSIYEFDNIKTTSFPLFSERSTYTDDSIMTVAVAEWLLSDNEHSHESLEEIMVRYAHEYPCPMGGYGGGFAQWLFRPERLVDYNTGEIAGKTGTTNNNADGWFIGYTPELTAGAWTGFENEQIHFQYIGNGGGSASALPLWGLFMKKVTSDPSLAKYYDKVTFERPVGYDIDLSCTGAETSSSDSSEAMDAEGMGTPIFDEYEDETEQYFE